ncbi:MAG: hypothetical protein WBV74_07560 [Pseudonocardiaceae bacterium]
MTRTTRATQVVALLLVALTMGLEFAHTLELGPKLNYPPELYLRLNTSLYAWFGPPLGAAINTGAIVATGALVWLMRRQRPALLFIGTAFVLQVAQLANYFARVEPVNVRFRALPLGQVPSDFSALRAQWEYGHAVGFALFTVAFLLLIAHPSATVVNSTAPTFSRGRMSVRSSSRRRPPDDMRATLELGVLAALLVSFVTIPLPVPHVVTAIAWVALTAIHVVRRRRIYAALLRSARSPAPPVHGRRRRIVATTALIGCAVVVTVSGFAQWAGLAAATPWHAGISMLLIGLAAVHAASRLWRMHRCRPVGSRSALVAHRRPATRTTR